MALECSYLSRNKRLYRCQSSSLPVHRSIVAGGGGDDPPPARSWVVELDHLYEVKNIIAKCSW